MRSSEAALLVRALLGGDLRRGGLRVDLCGGDLLADQAAACASILACSSAVYWIDSGSRRFDFRTA
jgi:hypothetical protein